MNRRNGFTFVLACFALTCCLGGVRTAQAAPEVETSSGTFENVPVLNPCYGEDGEEILISGQFHAVSKTTTNKDGTVTVQVISQAHGTGIGVESGNPYVFNDTFRSTQNFTGPPCGFTSTDTQHTRLISRGELPNALLNVTINLGFDQDCEFFFNPTFALKCSGQP